jgi:hypothetical protein
VARDDNKIELIFIINGANFPLDTNVNAPLKEAVARALQESGNTGRPPSDWQVRDANGVLLDIDRKIKDLGLTNGARLFLSLGVGAGGALRS